MTIEPPEPGAVFVGSYSISPDGKTLAYKAKRKDGPTMLYVQPLASTDSRAIPGSESLGSLFWSADSRFIAFTTVSGITRVELASGARETIVKKVGFTWPSCAWNRGGVILCPDWTTGINRIPASGGAPTPVFPPDQRLRDSVESMPQFLPDDNHFLFYAVLKDEDNGATYASSLTEPQRRIKIMDGRHRAQFAAGPNGTDGWLLFVRGDALLAQAFDAGRLKLQGEPVAVVEHYPGQGPGRTNGAVSVSNNGVLVYPEANTDETRHTLFDRKGTKIGDISDPGQYRGFRLSPDEKSLATLGWDGHLWLIDLVRGSNARLTSSGNNLPPVWSPDGKEIAWFRVGQGVYRKRVSGGAEELLHPGKLGFVWSWSPDGRNLLYSEDFINEGTPEKNLWVLPIGPGAAPGKPYRLFSTPFLVTSGAFSPDGRWVAYRSNEAGSIQVYIQPFPPTGAQWLVSTSSGSVSGVPRWRGDGRELFYLTEAGGKMMSVAITASRDGVSLGRPRELFAAPDGSDAYDVSRNGDRFVMLQPVSRNSRPVVLLNWTAALQR